MLQSQDSVEKESYEEEAKLSRDREDSLAASAPSYSADLDENSKAKVGALPVRDEGYMQSSALQTPCELRIPELDQDSNSTCKGIGSPVTVG